MIAVGQFGQLKADCPNDPKRAGIVGQSLGSLGQSWAIVVFRHKVNRINALGLKTRPMCKMVTLEKLKSAPAAWIRGVYAVQLYFTFLPFLDYQ